MFDAVPAQAEAEVKAHLQKIAGAESHAAAEQRARCGAAVERGVTAESHA